MDHSKFRGNDRQRQVDSDYRIADGGIYLNNRKIGYYDDGEVFLFREGSARKIGTYSLQGEIIEVIKRARR